MENHNLLLIDDDFKKILDYSKSQLHCKVSHLLSHLSYFTYIFIIIFIIS